LRQGEQVTDDDELLHVLHEFDDCVLHELQAL
jgi:hypothetical protein